MSRFFVFFVFVALCIDLLTDKLQPLSRHVLDHDGQKQFPPNQRNTPNGPFPSTRGVLLRLLHVLVVGTGTHVARGFSGQTHPERPERPERVCDGQLEPRGDPVKSARYVDHESGAKFAGTVLVAASGKCSGSDCSVVAPFLARPWLQCVHAGSRRVGEGGWGGRGT